jgi:MSHA biogenesis protein MshK
VFRSTFIAACLMLMFPVVQAFALDPTRPPFEMASAPVVDEAVLMPRLQAILRMPGDARAVINGQTLKVGEQLADVRLLAIHSHSVLIEREGKREELRLSAAITQMSRTQP